jgi:hypothetical protein
MSGIEQCPLDNDVVFVNLTTSIWYYYQFIGNLQTNETWFQDKPFFTPNFTWNYAFLTLWEDLINYLDNSLNETTDVAGCMATNLWNYLQNSTLYVSPTENIKFTELVVNVDNALNLLPNLKNVFSSIYTYFPNGYTNYCQLDSSNKSSLSTLYNLISDLINNCTTSSYVLTCDDNTLLDIAKNLVILGTIGCPYDTNVTLSKWTYEQFCHDPNMMFIRAYLNSPIYPSDINSTLFNFASNLINGSDLTSFKQAFNYIANYSGSDPLYCTFDSLNTTNPNLQSPNSLVCILANIYDKYLNLTNQALPQMITTTPFSYTPENCGLSVDPATGDYTYTECQGNKGSCNA